MLIMIHGPLMALHRRGADLRKAPAGAFIPTYAPRTEGGYGTMETFGDALIVAEAMEAEHGPMARLYWSQWEASQTARKHPWRVRCAQALRRLAATLTP